MYKNGDRVIVQNLIEENDKVPCYIVGIGARHPINGTPLGYIVKPIEFAGEWECYSVLNGYIIKA